MEHKQRSQCLVTVLSIHEKSMLRKSTNTEAGEAGAANEMKRYQEMRTERDEEAGCHGPFGPIRHIIFTWYELQRHRD